MYPKYVAIVFLGIFLIGCPGNEKIDNPEKKEKLKLTAQPKKDSLQFLEIQKQESASIIEYQVIIKDSSISGFAELNLMLYDTLPGISTFRAGYFRDMKLTGILDSIPTSISVDWTFNTDYGRKREGDSGAGKGWGGGSGWTGQPSLIVDAQTQKLTIHQGSLCGKVYSLDYDSGKEIDSAIDIENPIKGSVSVDPVYRNVLYVGQGIRYTPESGARCFNLKTKKQIAFQNADDNHALRRWSYFDSSPIAWGKFLIWPAENGILYKFNRTEHGFTPHSKFVYKVKGNPHLGLESSIAIYGHYGIITDNGGSIICLDLNTLEPMWYSNNSDDTDATPVISIEDGNPYLYTGCEVDKQGSTGISIFRKLDILTGNEIWRYSIPCHSVVNGSHILNGGMLGTPLLGKGNCSSLIFTSFVYHKAGNSGVMMAFDKRTGKVVWTTELSAYSWSSPIGYLTKKNELVMLLGDVSGNVYLFNARNGAIITKKRIGNNFEASPIPWNNSAIIASRGTSIFKLRLH